MTHRSRRRRHSKVDPQQTGFPFDAEYRERFQLLDAITHERAGLSRVRWRNCRDYLKAVHHFDCNGNGCWAGEPKLIEQSKLSKDQLRKAKRDALDRGFVAVQRRGSDGRGGYGRATDITRIDWEKISGLPAAEQTLDRAAKPPNSRATFSNSRATFSNSRAAFPLYIEEEIQKRDSELHPPPTSPAESAAATHADAWAGVVEELNAAGVNQAAAAVDEAKKKGATPTQVLALIAWWRDHRDGLDYPVENLYRRVRHASPKDRDPTSGWPTFRRGYVPPERIEQRRIEVQRQHEQRSAAAVEKAHTKREWEALRRAVESIPPDERCRILDEHRSGWRLISRRSDNLAIWSWKLVASANREALPRPP